VCALGIFCNDGIGPDCHKGGYRKSSRAECVEIEEVDRAADQKKKEDEEKYSGSAAALIVRLARDEVRSVR
jgi:hypothetical protein